MIVNYLVWYGKIYVPSFRCDLNRLPQLDSRSMHEALSLGYLTMIADNYQRYVVDVIKRVPEEYSKDLGKIKLADYDFRNQIGKTIWKKNEGVTEYMRLGNFKDNGGNVSDDMFTLSLSDEFVKDIEDTEFENEDINDLNIITKSGKRNGYKKVTIPIVRELYTCLEEYILKYELMGASYYKSFVNTNTGYFVYNYSWVETYERVEETIESGWYIIGMDRLYFDKQEMKRILTNYKRIEDN